MKILYFVCEWCDVSNPCILAYGYEGGDENIPNTCPWDATKKVKWKKKEEEECTECREFDSIQQKIDTEGGQ